MLDTDAQRLLDSLRLLLPLFITNAVRVVIALAILAAGVMLPIFRPFRIGDRVQVAGIDGTVRELSLFWTELVSADNVQVIIPNAGVWGQPLRNFSTNPQAIATAELRFRLPGVDPIAARDRIEAIVRADAAIRATPPPAVLLDRAAEATEIVVTFVPAEGNAAAVKSALIAEVHTAFARQPA